MIPSRVRVFVALEPVDMCWSFDKLAGAATIGNFKNGRREWQPQGEPELVDVQDFPGDALGKAIPYGVYDVAANHGFVGVGVDHSGLRGDVDRSLVETSRRKVLPQGPRALHHC